MATEKKNNKKVAVKKAIPKKKTTVKKAPKKKTKPSSYEIKIKPNLDKIKQWVDDGLSNQDIADNLNMARNTLQKHLREQEELREIFNSAKNENMQKVKNVFLERALEGSFNHGAYYLNNFCGVMTEKDKRQLELMEKQTKAIENIPAVKINIKKT